MPILWAQVNSLRRAACKLLAVAAVLVCALPARGQTVFSYIDEGGVRVFTNVPPRQAAGSAAKFALSTTPEPATATKPSMRPSPYNSIIEKYSRQQRLDPLLVHSIIAAESAFNPKAVSPKGARGLMQLMPRTAAGLGVSNSFDPEENIRGGVQHLRSLLDTFNDDLLLSLAAYNAGEGLVQRINRVPNYPETQEYIRRVARFYAAPLTETAAASPENSPSMYRYVDAQGTLHLTNIPPMVREQAPGHSNQALAGFRQ